MKIISEKSQRVSDALHYNYDKVEKGDAYLLDSNITASNYEMAQQGFRIVLSNPAIHARTKNVVSHLKLSLHVNDSLSDLDFLKSVRYTLDQLNFKDCPYITFRHTDEPHEHVHVVVSRINLYGECVSDKFDYFQIRKIEEQLDEEYQLISVKSRLDAHELRPQSHYEKAREVNDGGVQTKIDYIRTAVIESLKNQPTLQVFVERLARRNVGIVFHPFQINRENEQQAETVYGLSYSIREGEPVYQNKCQVITDQEMPESALLELKEKGVSGIYGDKKTRWAFNINNELKKYVRGVKPLLKLTEFSIRASRLGPLMQWKGLIKKFRSIDFDYLKNLIAVKLGNRKRTAPRFSPIEYEHPSVTKLIMAVENSNTGAAIEALMDGASKKKVNDNTLACFSDQQIKFLESVENYYCMYYKLNLRYKVTDKVKQERRKKVLPLLLKTYKRKYGNPSESTQKLAFAYSNLDMFSLNHIISQESEAEKSKLDVRILMDDQLNILPELVQAKIRSLNEEIKHREEEKTRQNKDPYLEKEKQVKEMQKRMYGSSPSHSNDQDYDQEVDQDIDQKNDYGMGC